MISEFTVSQTQRKREESMALLADTTDSDF